MSIERLKQILQSFPRLRSGLVKGYAWMRYAATGLGRPPLELHAGARIVTPAAWASAAEPSGQLFFGYYDKSPWGPGDGAMVLHRSTSGSLEVEIQLYERSRAAILNLATSRAWTWQQGAMTQWLDGGRVIFNDVVNGMLCSRIVDTQGREEQVIPFPVQTLHPDGRGALSLNYRRLFRLRPEYGYAAEVRNFSPDQALEHDGIWQVDLASGRGDLLVSLAELMEAEPREGMSWEMTKVNHVIVSPTGRHCLFMHRWFGPRGKHSRLYVMNWDGSGRRILLDTGMISHYHWKDDRSVVVYGRDLRGKDGYLLLDVETGHGQPLSGGALDGFGDGHPSFGPGGEWLVTDSYPDREYMQYLVVHRPSRGDLQVVARMRHSPRYAGATRCDLHPRWSRGGNMLSVDSVCHGSRRSFIVDVSSMVAQEGHGETLCRRDS